MRYSRVHVDAISYALAPVVVTSSELERRVRPLYERLHLQEGQLELLTGISERRWWKPSTPLRHGALTAARRAIEQTGVQPEDLEVLIYGAVCREAFEPATACGIAAELGVNPHATVYDLSNACLGMLSGMLEIANRIELGQIRAGMVVSCESARQIVDIMIDELNGGSDMEFYKQALATLTGGSGAAAILMTDGSFKSPRRHKLLGGVTRTEPKYHELCRWGLDDVTGKQVMQTDAVSVLKYGVELGAATWRDFLKEMSWTDSQVDRVICHQVGSGHGEAILGALQIAPEKDFTTYEFLGNMGTVSLPTTAALAEEREVLESGHRVGFLGIGSGLNCMMLGLEW